jgi:hypothetical protein
MGKRTKKIKLINGLTLEIHKKGVGKAGHFLGLDSGRMNNGGGYLSHITRPIRSMSSKGKANSSFDKKKWQKRVRGYFKSNSNNNSLFENE